MYPVHGCMPYFPQFYTQNKFPQVMHQDYPFWGVVPPVVNAETVKAPSSFAPSSGNAHPNQSESTPYRNCNCYPISYSNFPPHPQSQPLPMYFCGPYPPHPNVFPSYYSPSTGYLPEQHVDCSFGKNHCCGCPNHECPKQDSNYVLERKDQKSSGQKLDDCHSFRYNPYPMICIPGVNSNNVVHDIPKPNFMPPNSWKGWIPVDGLQLAEEVGKNDKKQNEANFPIFWLPSNQKPEEAEKVVKEIQPSPKIEEVPSCNVKIIPVKQSDCGNRDDNGAKLQHDSERKDDPIYSKKVNKSKIIPVQHVPSTKENHVSATGEQVNEEVKLKNNKREDENEKSMSSLHSGTNLTPVKSSKLPPVCLRVDPLPKNKKANGSSRLSGQVGQKKEGATDKTENQGPWKETISAKLEKEIKVAGDVAKGNNRDLQSLVHDAGKSVSEVPEMSNLMNCELRDDPNSLLVAAESLDNMKQSDMSCNFGEVDQTKCKKPDSSSGAPSQENVKTHLHLSETDAAIIIQATYRGFEVRKWQPLKKLKQIRAVHGKATDIKEKINSLESTSGEQIEDKTKVFLNEAIMNLLLELDTIQGLHPNVREIRKSVAQELVFLQERLDMRKKKPSPTDELSSDYGSEQVHDLHKTEANKLAASAVENFPDTWFLKENVVTCSDQGDSRWLEHDYSIGKEDGCLPGKEIVVDLECFSKVPEHLPGGCADDSVEEHGCTDASMDDIGRVPTMGDTVAFPTEAALLVSSQTSSNQLECSTEVNKDASSVENGFMCSGTEEASGSLQEGEKETRTKDLDCSFETEVRCDSSVVDIPINVKPDAVVPKPDEVFGCLAVGLNCENQSGGSEKAEDKEGMNVSLETSDLKMTMQCDSLELEVNDMSRECNHLEQQPLVMSPEQGKQVQAEEPKQILDYLDRELGPSEEEEDSRGKLDVCDALLVRDDANYSVTKELEKQLLHCADLHEAKKGGETCILGLMNSDHVFNNDQTIPDNNHALAADSSTATAVAGLVSVSDTGEDNADAVVVVGPSEAISLEIPSESCFLSEVQSENHERPDVGASLSLEERKEWKKWQEQDEGLRTMLHKLFEAGQKQMQVMSELTGRVNRLERRLSHKRRLRLKRRKGLAGAACATGVSPLAVKSTA